METLTLDCRLLEPPEPMIKVLKAVSRLRRGQQIQMLHRMRPTPLFAKLIARGMAYRVEEKGSHVEVWIWLKEDP